MKPTDENGTNYLLVSTAAEKLGEQACTLGIKHINDGTLRLQFNREVACYARSIVNDVSEGKKSPEQGLKEIKDEQDSLFAQSWEVAKKGVGAVAGAMQVVAGAGICYGSVGTLCLVAGLPIMAHGANNVYENGRNLWEGRSDTEGPVRKGYQAAAKAVGYGAREGNMAYGSADLAMSVYGVTKLVLKPDSWRLFRYIRTDYVRAYRNTSVPVLVIDRAADAITVDGIQKQ
ncbi:DUF4225 domain-containing protein [Pseudomonas congelans]|uniref:DUF4225 domain-containing protein n=1 Tax=Pseudomonas congelans TaxID=200452 RepID=UPI001863AE7C|nr:DUF4225 domain-containing protein [Pseudomonas congelans]